MGFDATAWDPYFDHGTSRVEPSSVVMLLYVLNVIERASERATTLKAAWDLTRGTLVVSARLTWDARRVTGEDLEDGVLTSRGTFQHLYTTEELRSFVQEVTGARCFVAAPGVVYAFREDSDRMAVIARRCDADRRLGHIADGG